MKKYMYISLLSFLFLFNSCSFPHKLPTDGIWYNENLGISFECITEIKSGYTEIINIVWNSKTSYLNVHLGFGGEIYFYYIDENGNELNLLEGTYEYSNDEFVVTASRIAKPFDIYGNLSEINDEVFIFKREPSNITTS